MAENKGAAKSAPNVKLREGATPATVSGEVHAPSVSSPISLPDEDAQKKGWNSPDAAALIRLYPDRYIPYTDKGGK